jgi:dolichol-phosphate mannosyltransferase
MAIFVIPAFNEEANVSRLLDDIESRPQLWRGGSVLLVDDGSTDATVQAARAHRGDLPIQIVRQNANQGAGRAFDRGFRTVLQFAPPDALIVTLECDTTSDLDAVEEMLATARSGADVVLASHHGGGVLINVGARRRYLSKAASYAIRQASGVQARTVSSFFRVYRASALRAAYARYGDGFIRESGFACKAEILIKMNRMGLRIAEVPVALDWSRREGQSKLRVLPTVSGYARLLVRHVATAGRHA